MLYLLKDMWRGHTQNSNECLNTLIHFFGKTSDSDKKNVQVAVKEAIL